MAFTKSYEVVGASNQYVSVSMAIPANDLTCEGWFYFTSLPTDGNQFWFWYFNDGSPPRSFFVGLYNNFSGSDPGVYSVFFQTYGGSQGGAAIPWAPTTGTWYHVAVTYNNTTGVEKLYINSVQQGADQSIGAGGLISVTANFRIGRGTSAATTGTGDISNHKLWSTVRTPAQIGTDMCATLGTTTGLLGEWSLDNVLTDNSGNGHTFTNNNTGAFVTNAPSSCNATFAGYRALLGVGI